MKRAILAVVMTACILPARSAAQTFDSDYSTWGSRLRVTPFVGFAPAMRRTENWIFVGSSFTAADVYDVDLASGKAAGAAVEVQIYQRFGLLLSGAWLTRGRTIERSEGTGERFRHEGGDFVLAKAALAIRLLERVSELQVHSLTGTLFAGPAYIREMPKPDVNAPDPVLLQPLTYTGINVGLDIELPLVPNRLVFAAGVEDFYFKWNDAEMARRNDIASGGVVESYVETDPSHTFLITAGLSFRIH